MQNGTQSSHTTATSNSCNVNVSTLPSGHSELNHNGIATKANGTAFPSGVRDVDQNGRALPAGEWQTSDVETDGQCSCGCCQPSCLQHLANPITYLICISAMALTQSFLVSGYTSSIVTTLERRYDLWSSDLGFIISSYDITCTLSVIVVSYYGDRYNRARWIGRGAVLMAIGAAIFTLPHFFGREYVANANYNQTEVDVNLCNSTANMDAERRMSECDEEMNTETLVIAVFVVAEMVIGIGASPIYILGPTYLYDNVKPQLYSIYAGVMYAMSALGPALGFLMGAVLLQLYVIPGGEPDWLTDEDPSWVGAWWIGFLICAVLSFAVGMPLLCFPKKLPEVATTGGEQDRPVMMSFGKNIKDFPHQLKKLFLNAVWLFVSLTLVLEQTITTGFVVFIAKYFQISFDISASKANVFTGSVIIPGAVAGIMIGSYVMKRLHLDSTGIIKLLLMLNFVPALGVGALLFLGCKNVDLAGITSAYTSDLQPETTAIFHINYKNNLTAKCNANCACSHATYQPVCAFDQRTYFSPCHAGCTKLHTYNKEDGSSVRNYSSCQCVYEEFVHQSDEVILGKCDNGCINLIPFLVLIFIIIFVTACGQTPVLLITLRSVNADRRSFALGIQNVLTRLLAFIPAPIYFGRIFDSQCLLRSASCDRDGSCLEYDTRRLPFVLFGTCLAIKCLAMLCLASTYVASRYHTRKDEKSTTSAATSPTTDISTVSGSFSPYVESTRL